MAKKWKPKDDEFLIQFADVVGANYVASHDLGFADGAGERRMKVLRDRGAVVAYWKMKVAVDTYNLSRLSDAEKVTEYGFSVADSLDASRASLQREIDQ